MDYRLERGQYANIYGCTARSIGNYEADNAPLDDPEAMYHWLWKRRTQPAGFTGKSIERLVSEYARVIGTGDELDDPVRERLREYLAQIDGGQMCLRCVILGAEQKGFTPPYREQIFAATRKILAAVEEAYASLGIDIYEGLEDEEGEDAEEEASDPATLAHSS